MTSSGGSHATLVGGKYAIYSTDTGAGNSGVITLENGKLCGGYGIFSQGSDSNFSFTQPDWIEGTEEIGGKYFTVLKSDESF